MATTISTSAAYAENMNTDEILYSCDNIYDPEPLREFHNKKIWSTHRKKVPYNPLTGKPAKSNDPNTFVYFRDVTAALDDYDGVEILLGEGLCAIDLDHCIDPETRIISEEAYRIVDMLDSYSEISPSGEGIHILAKGSLPFSGKQGSRDGLNIEMYSERRVMTVTGNVLLDRPIAERTEQLKQLADIYFPLVENKAKDKPVSPTLPELQDGDQKMVLSALEAIDPVDCEYDQWKNIGIALKEAGFEPDTWAEWSCRDPDRYVHGECAKKWRSFDDPGDNEIGPGTIIRLAKMNGWNPGQAFTEDEKKEYFKKKALAELKQMNLPPVSATSDESAASDHAADNADVAPVTDGGDVDKSTMSVSELLNTDLKKPDFIVDDLLAVGGAILAGPPKIGKSLFSLSLACSVASGNTFLGHTTNQMHVQYYALEDTFGRLQDRLIKQDHTELGPDTSLNLSIPKPEDVDDMYEYIKEDIRNVFEKYGRSLIIIDTLQCIRPAHKTGKSEYEQDYPIISELSSLARESGSAIVLVHHTRKTSDEANPFNTILGSTALQGATDQMMVMSRSKKQFAESKATLHITGRDVGMSTMELFFSKVNITWYSAKDLSADLRQREYANNPVITVLRTIMEEIEDNPDIEDKVFITTAQGLLDEVITRTGECTDLGPRDCGSAVREFADLLLKDGIRVTKPTKSERVNGVSGSYFRFSLV